MWWDQLKKGKHLDEKSITWRQFKAYLQEKYFLYHYYERNMKDLFELKLGIMTMDEYWKMLFESLKYVDFIKHDNVKIQEFLSGLPSSYSEKIQYDNPNTLVEAKRRKNDLYEKTIGRLVFQKAWNGKMNAKRIRGRKDLSNPFSTKTPKKINKFIQPKMSTIL
jgi:hypothetical protein